jgi:hypothetical protein
MSPSPRFARRWACVGLTVLFAFLPTAASSAANAPNGPCTTSDGVTVVVDLTDVGGRVEIGCAAAPATGTAALEAAGFTETRDASQMICAINGAPNPCPATFTGSYWSYWHAAPGGAWVAYQVGSDAAVPGPGQVEGWRYADGSAGPRVTPPTPAAKPAAPSASATLSGAGATAQPATNGPSDATLAGLGLLAVLAVLAVLVARRRSVSRADGPPGQD